MVAKLMKHELYALFRILTFFAVAILVLAVAGRILVYFAFSVGSDFTPLTSLTIFVIIFYIMAISAFALVAYILGINRFYRTLFTGEGYMTLSLPATATQLIWAKLLSALIGVFFASAVSGLSLTIFLVGWNAETMREIVEVFGAIGEALKLLAQAEPLIFFEGIVLALVMLPMGLLVIFAIISLGQMFTSHRKLATFLIFLGLYYVGNSAFAMLLETLLFLTVIISPHLLIWIYIVLVAGIDVGCFFLIRYILRNKVNLIA